MIKKTIDNIENRRQKFYLKLDEANIKLYLPKYRKMTDKELHQELKSIREYLDNLSEKLKKDNIFKTYKTIERYGEMVVAITMPMGIVAINIKRRLEPLKQTLIKIKAINTVLEERKKQSVKESNIDINEQLKELNGVQLIESVIENVEEHASMLMNYVFYNEPVMSTEDCSIMLDKINNINIPETNTIKSIMQKSIELNETGSFMLHDLYVSELRSRTILSDNMKNLLNECVVNPLCPDSSVFSIFEFMCEANNTPDYATTLITDVLPIAKRLIMSNESYLDFLEDLPDVIYKNIVAETNYSNLIPLRYIINENLNEVKPETDWYKNKLQECKELLDSRIREICKNPELNKILDENIEYDDNLVKLVSRANKVYSEMVRESIYLLSQDEETELTIEQLTKVTKLCMTHQAIIEAAGHQSLVWKAGHAIDKTSRKILNNGKGAYDTSGRNTSGMTKAAQNIEKLINYPINKIIKSDKAERKDRIIEGRWRLKIWKLVRKAIMGNMLYVAFGPISAAIGLMASVALDKKLDRRVRNDIVHEMETELRVVNEKIEDAKGENDKKEKYQLMRLKDKLEKDIQRVKYGLNGKY